MTSIFVLILIIILQNLGISIYFNLQQYILILAYSATLANLRVKT